MSVVVNQYLVNLAAQQILGLGGPHLPWQVHLYINLYSPTPTSIRSNFQECALPGYSPITLNPSSWSGGIVPPDQAGYTYPQITWVFDPYTSAQQTIFGYWVDDTTGGILYAELFPAPFPVPPAGGELPMIPTFTTEQCPFSP